MAVATVKAAIEALRHDADMWDQVAAVTRLSGDEARTELTLTEADLSWAGNGTGLIGLYAQVQTKIADLLGQATKTQQQLSAALDQVASAYQASDKNAATELKGVWDVRQ